MRPPCVRRLVLIVLSCGFTVAGPAMAARLVERTALPLPDWSAAVETTEVDRYATPAEYEAALADPAFSVERLVYRSDDVDVVAYLHASPDAEGARPGIVFNRGSYVRGEIAPELAGLAHRLVRAGYTVLAPMYRGSAGAAGRDAMGGADLADLMVTAELADELPGIDARRLFLYGESRGGMMVLQALRDGYPARAAATFGAFTDLSDLVAGEAGRAMADAIWPDFGARRTEIIARRSALQWPDALKSPLLILHGGDDDSVPVRHSLDLARALADGDTEFGVVVFPGGDHLLFDERVARDGAAAAFFARHDPATAR